MKSRIKVVLQLFGLPPVFDVPQDLDVRFVRYKQQDYCLCETTSYEGRFWISMPVDPDYCDHIPRYTVD